MERKAIWLVGALTLVLLLVGVGTSLAVVDKTGTVPAAATIAHPLHSQSRLRRLLGTQMLPQSISVLYLEVQEISWLPSMWN
ncbi:hypothetical protein MUO65_01105 [bacterium]|nr:hypothetical protein [bacterium]